MSSCHGNSVYLEHGGVVGGVVLSWVVRAGCLAVVYVGWLGTVWVLTLAVIRAVLRYVHSYAIKWVG